MTSVYIFFEQPSDDAELTRLLHKTSHSKRTETETVCVFLNNLSHAKNYDYIQLTFI